MSCLYKIEQQLPDFSKSEKKVAQAILMSPETYAGKPIDLLAMDSGTSKSAVVRFCKALEFSGYKEFSLNLASELAVNKNKTGNRVMEIQIGDSTEIIIASVIGSTKQAIEQTLSVLDLDRVDQVVKAMYDAERIDFYGFGASGIVALDAQQKFIRINKVSYAFTDSHVQQLIASTSNSGTVAVIFSYSGRTKECIEAAKTCKSAGSLVVAVGKYGNSPMSKLADINLSISAVEHSLRSAALGSRIMQLLLVDVLFLGVLSMGNETFIKTLDATREVLRKRKL